MKSETLLILVTNDTHSNMVSYEEGAADGGDRLVGGAARRQTYFRQRAPERPLILDVGDSFQGSPFFSFFGGEVEFAAMGRMGYRATAIGNHDFDSGLDELRRHAREQSPEMKLLCANLRDGATDELYFEPHALYAVGDAGWKVGVVGLMGEEAWSVVDNKLRGGLLLEEPFAAARRSVATLRGRGAELVVCLSHTGCDEARGPTNDAVLAELGLFDAVFSGHAHFAPRRMGMQRRETSGGGAACLLHPGVHNGQAVVWARFEMARDSATGEARCVAREGGADLIDESYAADPVMASWLAGYAAQFEELLEEELGTCVGLTQVYPDGGAVPPINWTYHSSLARALLLTFEASGAQFAAINSAGVRGDLPAGMLQYRHVEACWPWKNNAHRCECSGELVREMLERNASQIRHGRDDGMFLHFAGLEYRVLDGEPLDVVIAGTPWEAGAWYRFVADGYLVTSSLSDYGHAPEGRRDVVDCAVGTQECFLGHVRALHAEGVAFGAT